MINVRNVIEFDLTQKQNSSKTPSASQHTQQLRRSKRINRSVSSERFAYVVRHNTVYDPKGWLAVLNIKNPQEKMN